MNKSLVLCTLCLSSVIVSIFIINDLARQNKFYHLLYSINETNFVQEFDSTSTIQHFSSNPVASEVAKHYPYLEISQSIYESMRVIDWKLFQNMNETRLDRKSEKISIKCQNAVSSATRLVPKFNLTEKSFHQNDFKNATDMLDCENNALGLIFTGNKTDKIRRIFNIFYFVPTDIDVILIRMHELNDSIDYFVILESELTQRGHLKQFLFEDVKLTHYKSFLPKILYLQAKKADFDYKKIKNNDKVQWYVENRIRQLAYTKLIDIYSGSLNITDEDYILTSDTDEIPYGQNVRKIKHCELSDENKPVGFALMLHHANYFWLLSDPYPSQSGQAHLWIRSAILTIGQLKRNYGNDLNKVRHALNSFQQNIGYMYGGHHLTWRATALHELFKMCSMCETGHYDHEFMDLLLSRKFAELQRKVLCKNGQSRFSTYQNVISNNKYLADRKVGYQLPKIVRENPTAFIYLQPYVAELCSMKLSTIA